MVLLTRRRRVFKMSQKESAPLPYTGSSLLAAARVISEFAKQENDSFVACKKEDMEPSHCIDKGATLLKRVNKIMKHLHEKCGPSFAAYEKCIDDNFHNFDKCRESQKAFDACWKQMKLDD